MVMHSAHSLSQVGIQIYVIVIHIKCSASMIDIHAELAPFFCL
jgi:hypothetical protein